MVSRRLLEKEEHEQRGGASYFTENEAMKRRFKAMVESLPNDIKMKAMRELLYMFDLPVGWECKWFLKI